MFMVMSYQVLNFSLRFFRPNLLYFFYAIFYHFWQPAPLLFNLNIFLSKNIKYIEQIFYQNFLV